MPKAARSPLLYAFYCFPPASPALAPGAGKQKTAPKDRSKHLIFLKKTGAGEGIRTLDPNLGKVPHDFRRTALLRLRPEKSLRNKEFLNTEAAAFALHRPPVCCQLLGICSDQGHSRLILIKLPAGD